MDDVVIAETVSFEHLSLGDIDPDPMDQRTAIRASLGKT